MGPALNLLGPGTVTREPDVFDSQRKSFKKKKRQPMKVDALFFVNERKEKHHILHDNDGGVREKSPRERTAS